MKCSICGSYENSLSPYNLCFVCESSRASQQRNRNIGMLSDPFYSGSLINATSSRVGGNYRQIMPQVNQTDQELENLRRENTELKRQMEEGEKRWNSAIPIADGLQKQLQDKEKKLTERERELATAKSNCGELKERLIRFDSQVISYKEKVKQLESSLSVSQESNKKKENQINSLAKDFSFLKGKAEGAEKRLKEKEKELVKVGSELDRIKAISSSEVNRINDLQSKLQEKERENNCLREQLTKFQKQNLSEQLVIKKSELEQLKNSAKSKLDENSWDWLELFLETKEEGVLDKAKKNLSKKLSVEEIQSLLDKRVCVGELENQLNDSELKLQTKIEVPPKQDCRMM